MVPLEASRARQAIDHPPLICVIAVKHKHWRNPSAASVLWKAPEPFAPGPTKPTSEWTTGLSGVRLPMVLITYKQVQHMHYIGPRAIRPIP